MAITNNVRFTDSDGWVKVVDAADIAFCVQSVSGQNTLVWSASGAAPGLADGFGFRLDYGSGFTRAHFPVGDIYVRTMRGPAEVVVYTHQ